MHNRSRKSLATITLGLVLLFAQRGLAQDDALNFFKNYFITGDYQVGGVGLSGTGADGIATGTIHFDQDHGNDVPEGVEILAAFLYWQVVSSENEGPESGIAGATFNGFPLSTPDGPLAKVLDPGGTAPCWSSGGGTGQSGGSKRTYTYRADVLRFFDVDPVTGRHIVDGYSVQAPDSGNGNGVPNALGASLVVIYRDPQAPLNAVVMYDGGYTLDNSTPMMSQAIEGFYDAADTDGKMTHIVGSGQANKAERLLVDGNVVITDLRQEDSLPVGNRFLVYTLFPQANISLRLHWGPSRAHVAAAVGHSIFNRTSRTNVGELVARYGGGGHKGAGTCLLPTERADALVVEMVDSMKRDG